MQLNSSYSNYFTLANMISALDLSAIPQIDPVELCIKAGEYSSAYEELCINDPIYASSIEAITPIKQANNEMKNYFPTSVSRYKFMGTKMDLSMVIKKTF